jgi:eukaryotic-like serine/threonine-protein kinase
VTLTGRQIGRYTIRRKLGAGGMGAVYLAYDAALDRMAALKILSREFSDDDVRRIVSNRKPAPPAR